MQDKCFISGYSYESTMDCTTQYTTIEIGEFVVHAVKPLFDTFIHHSESLN